jgi:hypothetical protein
MELVEFIRRVQWVEAVLYAKDIGILHKRILVCAFKGAHFVKKLSLKIKSRKTVKSRKKSD